MDNAHIHKTFIYHKRNKVTCFKNETKSNKINETSIFKNKPLRSLFP